MDTMTSTFSLIRLECADDVARVTLNRPEKLNALNAAMHAELRQAIAAARDSRARALLLTGAGRGFCAGQDLSERVFAPDNPPDLGESIEKNYKPLVLALRRLEMPVVCAVNGIAAGAGSSLALAGDIVLAARSATFVQSFSRLGLVPDCGGTWFLPHSAGRARALGLALLGESISAEQAERWGLIWRCVDDEDLAGEADRIARALARGPTKGLVAIRRAIDAAATNALEQQLDLERDLQRELGRSADYREGVAAFLAKRAPWFTGG